MMFNPETSEIAKPSELLNSVKAIMSVLQSIENYGECLSDLDDCCFSCVLISCCNSIAILHIAFYGVTVMFLCK